MAEAWGEVPLLVFCALLLASSPEKNGEPADVRLQGEPQPVRTWAPRRPTRHLVEGGLYLGGFFPSSDPELYDSTQLPPTGLGTLGPLVGLRLAYFPLPFVGAEAEGGMSVLDPDADGNAVAYNARGHLVLQWPGRLTPFLLGGGGLVGIGGNVGDDVDRSAHWGAGLKYYVDSNWSVRLDGRHLISARQGPDAGNTSHFEVSLGVGFALYRAPPPRPSDPLAALPAQPEPDPLPKAEPEPEPELAPAPIRPVEVEAAQNIETLLNDVRFGFDSAAIDPSMHPLLDRILEGLLRQEGLQITIVGHACNIGPERYNLQLSLRRAQAVKEHLVLRGVDPRRIQVRGEGEHEPKVPNVSEANRRRNRRTEFSVEATPRLDVARGP